ncbi:MAG TPA: response regulator transcription factor [Candidatus Acidoferrum sp.]|nr:response regulator transcription factor [Candidatus Acidoferrum sp.]
MKRLSILIADDHELVRRGIRQLLLTRRGWKLVGEATSGREAIAKIRKLKPNIAILDVGMPELDGLEATHVLSKIAPKTNVIILTMHDSMLMVRRALESGARGYVLKSDLTNYLIEAVQRVSEGKTFLTPQVSEILFREFTKTEITAMRPCKSEAQPTRREVEIIRLLAKGETNKEIAAMLGITVSTVETHRSKIFFKLGVHSLAQLIHYAICQGIIPVPMKSADEVPMSG